MPKVQPFFAVRVVLSFGDGVSSRMDFRKYPRFGKLMSDDTFVKYCVGEMLSIKFWQGEDEINVSELKSITVLEIDRHGYIKKDPKDFVLRCEECGLTGGCMCD